MQNSIIATVPMPPSDNARDKYQLAPAFEQAVAARLYGQRASRRQRYCVTLRFQADWETQAGRPKKRDVTNYQKLFLDVLCRVLGIDDSQFYEVCLVKAPKRGADECVAISLSPQGAPFAAAQKRRRG